MLSHKQVWDGIDNLAARNRLSASGLAKRAGLDPTTFNRSKRTTKQGKPRWPSTESIAKILDATGTSMRDFVEMMQGSEGSPRPVAQRLRCLSLSEVETGTGLDASGFPVPGPWEEIEFPAIDDPQSYAIELDRDVAPPLYRGGDLIVLSPSSSIRRNDRVLVRRRDGGTVIGVLIRRTTQRVVIDTGTTARAEQTFDASDVAWLARIVWVSQ